MLMDQMRRLGGIFDLLLTFIPSIISELYNNKSYNLFKRFTFRKYISFKGITKVLPT
jgi:hypothetical protein